MKSLGPMTLLPYRVLFNDGGFDFNFLDYDWHGRPLLASKSGEYPIWPLFLTAVLNGRYAISNQIYRPGQLVRLPRFVISPLGPDLFSSEVSDYLLHNGILTAQGVGINPLGPAFFSFTSPQTPIPLSITGVDGQGYIAGKQPVGLMEAGDVLYFLSTQNTNPSEVTGEYVVHNPPGISNPFVVNTPLIDHDIAQVLVAKAFHNRARYHVWAFQNAVDVNGFNAANVSAAQYMANGIGGTYMGPWPQGSDADIYHNQMPALIHDFFDP